MKFQPNYLCFCSLLLLFALLPLSYGQQCTYRIQVKTGSKLFSGTDAKVGLKVCSGPTVDACVFTVTNLAQYGTKGPNHNYFETSDLDDFVITTNAACIDPCRMVVSHDNSGGSPGWFVDFVKIKAEASGGTIAERHFTINDWIEKPALSYEITHCPLRGTAADLAASLLRQVAA